YEKSGNWFRLAIPGGSAWIERPNSDGFFSYPEDLAGESFSTYLRKGWDGRVWTATGAPSAISAPAGWRAHGVEEIPIRITSTESIRGKKWIRVRFETERCGTSLGNLPTLEGWLPAYRATHATSVWFYSRGC